MTNNGDSQVKRFSVVLFFLFFLVITPLLSFASDQFQSISNLIDAGKGDEAVKQLEGLDLKEQNNIETLYLLAVAHLLRKSEDQSEKYLQQVETMNGNNNYNKAEAYFWAGRILLADAENAHVGLHYINRAVSFSPQKKEPAAILLKARGIALADEKPWLAHRMLDKAVQFIPALENDDRVFYTYMIQTVYAPREQIKSADAFIEKYPVSPLRPEVLYKKAEALYMLGNFVDAKSIFSKIAGEYHNTQQGKDATERIGKWKEFRQSIVSVSSDPMPVNTHIVIEKGQMLTVSAQGFSIEGASSQGPEGRKTKGNIISGLPLNSSPPMALIGRIGEDGTWFHIGNSYVSKTERSGEIYLMMNRPTDVEKGIKYDGRYSTMIRVE